MAVSKKTKQKILELHKQGMSKTKIAKKCMVSRVTVDKVLKDSKQQKEKSDSNIDGELASKLFKLFDQGKSQRQIVIEENISPDIVSETYKKWEEMRSNEDIYCGRMKKLLDKHCDGGGNYDPFNVAVGYCTCCNKLVFYGREVELQSIKEFDSWNYVFED